MSDDEQHNYTYEDTKSGPSLSYQKPISKLRENDHVILRGRACDIVSIDNSGSVIHLVGRDIFTGRIFEETLQSTWSMDIPIIQRHEYTLIHIDDGFLNLLQDDGGEKDDVKLPDGELGKEIEKEFADRENMRITVLSALNEEQAISWK